MNIGEGPCGRSFGGLRQLRRPHRAPPAARSKETGLSLIATGRNPERGHAACGFDASIVQARLDIWDPDFLSLGVGLAVPLKGRRG